MRSLDEAMAAARPGPPFANGTEGYGWMENWCDRCLHDKEMRETGAGFGCPLILVAYQGLIPSEWLDGPRDESGRYGISDQYHCVEFRDEDDPGPGYEPTEPVSPDQMELFDATPYERPRMFADIVASVQPERAR